MFETQDISKTFNLLRQEYKCPISLQIMKNPVIDCEGISYQKANIQKWFQNNNMSPVTGNLLHSKSLIPNYYLEDLIKKVQTQVPVLFSFIQVLKNQINQLNLQNRRLESQRELNDTNSQIFESNKKEGSSIERMIHEGCKILNNQENEKYPSKFVENKTDKQQYKLSKTKLIKKIKFERFYDSKMSENIKQTNRDWEKHLQNLKAQQNQITNKLSQSLNMKEDIIERSKQTINQQSSKINELNKMIDQNQHMPNQILKKIEDLGKQVMSVISKNYSQYPQHIRDKFSSEVRVQGQSTNLEVNKNDHIISDQIESNQQPNKCYEKSKQNLQHQESLNISQILSRHQKQSATLKAQIEQYKQKLRLSQRDALIQATVAKRKYRNFSTKFQYQQTRSKMLQQTSVQKKGISFSIKSKKNDRNESSNSLENDYKRLFNRQLKQTHENWMLIIYAYEYFIADLTQSKFQSSQGQDQQDLKSKPMQEVTNKRQYMESQGILDKFKVILSQFKEINGVDLNTALLFYQKIRWTFTSLKTMEPTDFLSCFQVYEDSLIFGIKYGYQIEFRALKRILVELKETTQIWKEIACIYQFNESLSCDDVWDVLVRFRYLFPNLLQIKLNNCQIKDIKEDDFSRWGLLKRISLLGNPLTDKSKNELAVYKKQNPKVQVIF